MKTKDKTEKSVGVEKIDSNKAQEIDNNSKPIQAIQGNLPILSVQLLNSINLNLISILAYLKHRDIERK